MIQKQLQRVSDYEWILPRQGHMAVDALIFGGETLLEHLNAPFVKSLEAVASLPGILDKLILMPNFENAVYPNGLAAVFDSTSGVIIPQCLEPEMGCGVRMITTNLIHQDIEKKTETLLKEFEKIIPFGDNVPGSLSLGTAELNSLMIQGARWLIENRGIGKPEELDFIESNGYTADADPSVLSPAALKAEKGLLGTMGSGNNYIELQIVEEVFDIEKARIFGLFKNQVVVSFQTGSRTLGRQVLTEALESAKHTMARNGLKHSANAPYYFPASSAEGRAFLSAVRAVSNYAYANRQAVSHCIHSVFNDVIKDVDTNTMYDLTHHSIEIENYKIGPSRQNVIVHRRAVSRNFPGRMQAVPRPYKVSGQPVIIASSMGTASYVYAGREESLEKTFGSGVTGTGRYMNCDESARKYTEASVLKFMSDHGIILRAQNKADISRYAPETYKDIEEIVKAVNKSGLSQRVARLRPIGVLKG